MQDYFNEVGVVPLATLLALVMVTFVANAVTWWKLYAKAGESGWKYLVPVYRFVIMARIAKAPEKYGWIAGVFSAIVSFNHPISLVFFFGYIWAFIYILRDFIKQYDAPLIFWLYAVALPIIAVFQVNSVNYTATKGSEGQKLPKT